MTVQIPDELRAYVEGVVNEGTFHSESEVVAEALRLMQDRYRRLATLREDIRTGINSGPSIPADEAFRQLQSPVP